jgi:hypothetical protein
VRRLWWRMGSSSLSIPSASVIEKSDIVGGIFLPRGGRIHARPLLPLPESVESIGVASVLGFGLNPQPTSYRDGVGIVRCWSSGRACACLEKACSGDVANEIRSRERDRFGGL